MGEFFIIMAYYLTLNLTRSRRWEISERFI
jgi:hypothetical protein